MSAIKKVKLEKLSGYNPVRIQKSIKVIKKNNFIIINNFSVGGDAPKDFIKVYQYGKVKRKNKGRWIGYIAKTGHKWYPNESITEHLLNSIGKELGLLMSNSELAIISGQIRFLSQYFLEPNKQELIHGVDIFAGYVSDKDFVEEIEQKQLARSFFTFQFAEKAIRFSFPNVADSLLVNFVKLLVFDAIVGNNDRHFYNWGVVKSLDNSHKPYFSPIFDTARGLFWNDSEQKIKEVIQNKHHLASYLQKYTKKSLPKIGWDGQSNANHIELIAKIKQDNSAYSQIIDELLTQEQEKKVLKMIQTNFYGLFSVNRMFLITECLKLRFQQLRNLK